MPTETYTETYDTVGQHSLELPDAAENIHVTLGGDSLLTLDGEAATTNF